MGETNRRSRIASAVLQLIAFALLASVAGVAAGQDSQGELDRITLADGTVVVGTIVAEDEESITIESKNLGRLVIAKSETVRVHRASAPLDRSGWMTDPDYNSIMLVPTPETLPAGSGYFRDFELFFLNFGMGVTDDVNLSFATLFPVSENALMFGGGLKIRLLSRERFPIGLAVLGNVTHFDDENFGTAGGVVGIGDKHRSLNLSVQKTITDSDDPGFILLAGADIQTSERIKLIFEYATNTEFIDDEDFSGLINIGLRFFSDRMSFTLTGFRLITDEDTGLLFFPLGMFSMHW